mgnify:CR=1 FL=1
MRKLFVFIILIIGLGVGLAFDLANKGLVWQFAWSVTGEEEPISQMRGVIEWVGGGLRPQPNTQPMTPINHVNNSPYGINVFLNLEADPRKVDVQLRTIREAGISWLRQQFSWHDIEIDGRGQFTDSRHDRNGDGIPDTISAWDKYDFIVDTAIAYGFSFQARLDTSPAWSRSNPDSDDLGPPDDIQDFVNFAVAVAEHYKGRIHHYQIWNEPNIFPEWGPRDVSPEGYTDMLCRTYTALKAVDPNIVVITAALAPTVSLTGRDLNDFIYLQRMYDAGTGACFDIMAVQGYGLFSGPTDRRMRQTTTNIGRHIYIRDIMVNNGDAHKPIWISEAAWNFVPTIEENPNVTGIRDQFGQVTMQQAADYIVDYYQRAQEEWHWLGVINYWYFTRPDMAWANTPQYYFRMAEPDFSDEHPYYTTLPVYEAVKDYILTNRPMLYAGVHQSDDHWAIRYVGDNAPVEDATAQFGRAINTDSLSFDVYTYHATAQMVVRWRGDRLQICEYESCRYFSETPSSDGWNWTVYPLEYANPLRISLSKDGTSPLVIDSITIVNRQSSAQWGNIVLGIIGGLMTIIVILDILRGRARD